MDIWWLVVNVHQEQIQGDLCCWVGFVDVHKEDFAHYEFGEDVDDMQSGLGECTRLPDTSSADSTRRRLHPAMFNSRIFPMRKPVWYMNCAVCHGAKSFGELLRLDEVFCQLVCGVQPVRRLRPWRCTLVRGLHGMELWS